MATATETQPTTLGKPMLKHFMFEPGHRNLNHAAYGAAPRSVHSEFLKFQTAAIECPDRFIRYEQAVHLLAARKAIAALLHTDINNCVFLPNATGGINTVLRNLCFKEGDVIIYFSTIYGACEKTLFSLAETTPLELVKLPLVYGQDPKLCSDAHLLKLFEDAIAEQKATGKTVKVAMYDTITSMPGVRMPFEALTASCRKHGIFSLIDGAHGVGHFDLDLGRLDCDFLVSNAHKWGFNPRATAILYVAKRNQDLIRTTLPTSHGFTPSPAVTAGKQATNPLPPPPPGMTPFVQMFEVIGTTDISSYLATVEALRFRREVCGGEHAIYAYCSDLAKRGGDKAAQILGTDVMNNEEKTLRKDALMVNVRLPITPSEVKTVDGNGLKPGQEQELVRWLEPRFLEQYHTFLQTYWHGGSWWTRLSAQIYLDIDDFEWAARVLKELCARAKTHGMLDRTPNIKTRI